MNCARQLAILLVFASLGACREVAQKEPVHDLDNRYSRDALVIEADDGTRHNFDVWLALSHEQQSNGLMHVYDMPDNAGMLFVYGRPGIRSIWMKNTYIPLDLIYARSDGSIATIVHSAEPLTLASRSSSEPVQFVLELNGGTTQRLNIGANSRLIWEPDGGNE